MKKMYLIATIVSVFVLGLYVPTLKKVKDIYNIEKFMENKIMDLYGVTAGDLFE